MSFSKRSRDGSAKATLLQTDESEQAVYGVLFEVSCNEQAKLDKAEGEDYIGVNDFTVFHLVEEKKETVRTYRASPQACDKSLLPYDWYHALILAGAFQHGLPDTYIAELRQTIVRRDPEAQRHSRQEALSILRYVGFHRLSE